MSKHALADYVRILARGKNASRNMTREEARFTMSEMLAGRYRPEQLGAIFMLLRVLEESADEIAGFSEAINEYWPDGSDKFDLVWSSYAGKRRQPMWWVLSARLLTEMGYRILVHGTLAHTEGRKYAHEVFSDLSLPALTRDEIPLFAGKLAYLPVSEINPVLQEWLGLKSVLGVRSPINTVLKTIAPNNTPSVQGIFHPTYRKMHADAAAMCNESAAVIKGEGGEFEVNPERACVASVVIKGEIHEIRLDNDHSHYADKADSVDSQWLRDLWSGSLTSEYGEAAVIRTAALAWCVINGTSDIELALENCRSAWAAREIAS
ncbi:MAG: glycosyl transferase family protein [Thalassolituus sp.]